MSPYRLAEEILQLTRVAYQPEHKRYGGAFGIDLAEDIFHLTSQTTLDLLDNAGSLSSSVRLGKAVLADLVLAQAFHPNRVDLAPEQPNWLRDELDVPTGAGVRVAVIDSGWDCRIADSRIEQGAGLVGDRYPPRLRRSDDNHDRIGHGTTCTDLILRLAPAAQVIPLRVFGDRWETSMGPLISAIGWATDHEIPLVNLAWGRSWEILSRRSIAPASSRAAGGR